MSMAIRFQQMTRAIEKLRNTWPKAAEVLEKRYRAVDDILASGEAVSSDKHEHWAKLRTSFAASNQYDLQARTVSDLEEALKTILAPSLEPKVASDETSKLDTFLDADREYEALQTGPLGSLCKNLYRFNVPDRIYPLFVPK